MCQLLLRLSRLQLFLPDLGTLLLPIDQGPIVFLGNAQTLGQRSLIGCKSRGIPAQLVHFGLQRAALFLLAAARRCGGFRRRSGFFESCLKEAMLTAQAFDFACQRVVLRRQLGSGMLPARRG